jgi:hypothetical protein
MEDTEYLLRRKTVPSLEILYKDTKTDSVALARPGRFTKACAVGQRHMAVLAYPAAGCPNTYGAVLLTYGPLEYWSTGYVPCERSRGRASADGSCFDVATNQINNPNAVVRPP